MKYYVYIVECSDGTFYTGITNDVERRMEQHNGERPGGGKYTRGRRPVTLIYTEEVLSKSAALKRELEIKKLTHSQKAVLIGS